ncbi:MAG TPA: metal ABC transporter ATP-binding protein [bacterium]|nr:metal ABC transporter ATP-binding protein [bacterium]HPR88598.1 metal ABC transporter ATP-binding protein [bacterium]
MNDILITCEELSVAYQDKLALEDITFNVLRGEFWGILGPNGSGKTTLLRTMLGLIEPISGRITLFGRTPAQLGALRDKIGYVPQYARIDFNFPLRVRDMVLLGRSRKMGLGARPTRDDWRAVDQALERVEMSDLAQRQIGRLSGGQRQRALIARALALEPELLLLDEPTAALDIGATEGFYEWVHHMHEQMHMTLILVSHDVGVVSRYVSTVACLNRRLVAHGRPQEVLGSETLEGMYGCDALYFQHGEVPHMVVPTPAHSHHPAHPHP